MHDRDPPGNCLIVYGRKLYQEWCVDQYCKVESQRLQWVRRNQGLLRADMYKGLHDAVRQEDGLANFGQRVVLPSTFTGSPRHMTQLYQDSMAIVRAKGKPDLFITMTCNPEWPEILQEVPRGMVPNDRHDLIARVFRQKLCALQDDIKQHHIFGRVLGDISVVEFQKRGLPHAHLLVILDPEDKPSEPSEYDDIVCAEIPDASTHPRLHEVVTRCMLHGPCGVPPQGENSHSACMSKPVADARGVVPPAVCTKGYPRPYAEETTDVEGAYPVYRRRANGVVATKLASIEDAQGHVRREPFDFTNQWVVPYNPYLLLKYNCHINVEICSSITAVKYIYKYVYKGHDRALVSVRPMDGGQLQEVDGERARNE
jgi:hypothetical protein